MTQTMTLHLKAETLQVVVVAVNLSEGFQDGP
jgi:hypothetical protein